MKNNNNKLFDDAKKWMQSIAREYGVDGKKVELNFQILFCFLKRSAISTFKESLVDRQTFSEYSVWVFNAHKENSH